VWKYYWSVEGSGILLADIFPKKENLSPAELAVLRKKLGAGPAQTERGCLCVASHCRQKSR